VVRGPTGEPLTRRAAASRVPPMSEVYSVASNIGRNWGHTKNGSKYAAASCAHPQRSSIRSPTGRDYYRGRFQQRLVQFRHERGLVCPGTARSRPAQSPPERRPPPTPGGARRAALRGKARECRGRAVGGVAVGRATAQSSPLLAACPSIDRSKGARPFSVRRFPQRGRGGTSGKVWTLDDGGSPRARRDATRGVGAG